MKESSEFYEDFMTPEEKEQMLLDCVDFIAQQAANEDMQDSVIDPARVQGVVGVYKLLKKQVKGSNVKVKIELNEPFKNMGCVSVIGQGIVFENPAFFAAVSKVASNVEIYPKTDGTTQINFTFYGLTKPLERE